MKKIILALSVASAFGMVAANAATLAGEGRINFEGEIVADSCVLSPKNGSQTDSRNLTFQMGKIAANTLGTEDDPSTSVKPAFTTVPVTIELEVQCDVPAGKVIDLEMKAVNGVGKGLGTTGSAENVQVMLVDGNTVINFQSPYQKNDMALVGGKIPLIFQAYYTIASGKTITDVKPGTANAALTYTLSYD